MQKRIVEITQTALADMEKIYDYIADVVLTPENAMSQYNHIVDAILTLESNPERFPFLEAQPEQSWRMSRMVIDNYLVCYKGNNHKKGKDSFDDKNASSPFIDLSKYHITI